MLAAHLTTSGFLFAYVAAALVGGGAFLYADRRRSRHPTGWAIVTFAYLGLVLSVALSGDTSFVAASLLAGAAGLAVFRNALRNGVPRAGWWGIAVFLALAVALPLYLLALRRHRRRRP